MRVCVCDMRMCPSQQFAQFIQTAALYQRVCGGAPAAWCWAKSSSRLMWVTPAATGLRFIYLGKETGTQETQEDSDLTLKAANITENIKLLCYFSVFKWKLDDLSSHAFYPDTSPSVTRTVRLLAVIFLASASTEIRRIIACIAYSPDIRYQNRKYSVLFYNYAPPPPRPPNEKQKKL